MVDIYSANLGGIRHPITIGAGDNRFAVDVNSPSTAAGGGAARVIQSIAHSARQTGGAAITFLPGDYYFESPVRFFTPVEIRAYPGTNFYVRHSGAVGLWQLDSGASGSVITGGNVIVDRWVPSQEVIKFSACDNPTVDGLAIVMTTVGGLVVSTLDTHSTTPMRLLSFSACGRKTVRNCAIFPNHGADVIYAEYGQHLRVENNRFGSFDNIEIADFAGHTQASAKRVIHLNHDGNGFISGNEFESIGFSTTFFPTTKGPAVESAIYYQFEDGLDPQQDEAGHLKISGNAFEDVMFSNGLRFRGLCVGEITGNSFRSTFDEVSSPTEGVIRIEAEAGGSGQESRDIAIVSNAFFNTVSGTAVDGVALYLRMGSRCAWVGNTVKRHRGEYCVRLEPDDCPDFIANGNTYESASLAGGAQATAAYYIEDGSSPRYSIANEVASGMSVGVIDEGTVTGGTQNKTNLVSI